MAYDIAWNEPDACDTLVDLRCPFFDGGLAPDEIIVDHFAGGGGASTGVGFAAGRSPDIAINHNPRAIAMHAVNHRETKHYISNIWEVDPIKVCAGRRVGLLWSSPTCTHFSKAKGKALSEESIALRALAWVTVRWARLVAPRIICLENVEEFAKWGPLHRQHSAGCPGVKCIKGCTFDPVVKLGKAKNHIAGCPGVACAKKCVIYTPIKSRQSETFRAFVRRLEKLGYVVEWKILRACDYGAPTIRKRLFLVARRDGLPIVWPEPTHGPGREFPYVPAATCIDWSDLGTSIFERDRPLKDKTMRRIAAGVKKFVLDRKPFLVPAGYGAKNQNDARAQSVDDPLGTICGNRGSHSMVTPYLVRVGNGERAGQSPRVNDVQQPLGTILASRENYAAMAAVLLKHNGGHNDNSGSAGQDLHEPVHTVSTRDSKAIAAVHLLKMRGTSDAHVASSGSGMDEPVPTISAQGTHVAHVAALLVKYYGCTQGQDQSLTSPLHTVPTKDRFGLVTVLIEGETYAIVDIRMRMLTPRELYLAQGFPPDYQIERDAEGRPFTRTDQVLMVGNSVVPKMAEVIARAQLQAAPAAPIAMAA